MITIVYYIIAMLFILWLDVKAFDHAIERRSVSWTAYLPFGGFYEMLRHLN
jgi:hypothetical protein